jgi:hypothetical protein
LVCLMLLKKLLRGALRLYTGGVHIILPQTFERSNIARKYKGTLMVAVDMTAEN